MPKSHYRRRALVASIHDDDDGAVAASASFCLIWEDEVPRAIEGTFLVSPHFSNDNGNKASSLLSSSLNNGEGTEEVIVARSEVSELLSCEQQLYDKENDGLRRPTKTLTNDKDADYSPQSSSSNSSNSSNNSNNSNNNNNNNKDESAALWKECGDALLREKDAAAAVAFYELALRRTSRVQVGSTVLVQRPNKKAGGSAIVRADVDCINTDDNTIDLTMEKDEDDQDDNGAEQTVPVNHVRLGIDLSHADLQERILLNLTRCLLQLADQCPGHRRNAYLQGARLGCTMALTIPDATRQESALLLRSKANTASNKFSQALADVQQVLSLNPTNREGQKLIKDVERQKAAVAQTNKRLAKDVSQWVQTAMTKQEASSAEPVSDTDNASASLRRHQSKGVVMATRKLLPSRPMLMVVLVAILAWIVQATFFRSKV